MRISALLITKYDIQSSFLYRLPRKSLLDRVLPLSGVQYQHHDAGIPQFKDKRKKHWENNTVAWPQIQSTV